MCTSSGVLKRKRRVELSTISTAVITEHTECDGGANGLYGLS